MTISYVLDSLFESHVFDSRDTHNIDKQAY